MIPSSTKDPKGILGLDLLFFNVSKKLSWIGFVFFRNISLKVLTKNKKFLENYLGKIYKN